MELKLGFMSNEEMAKWFGLSNIKSLSNISKRTGKRKYEELSGYCVYEKKSRGFEIISILDPNIVEYSKVKPLVYELAAKKWNRQHPINTGANVGVQIYKERKDISNKVKVDTVSSYVNNWRRDNYGVPWVRNGEKGTCESFLTKQKGVAGQVEFKPLTKKENTIKNRLLKKYFGTEQEKIISIIQEYDEGNITADEVPIAISQAMNYSKENYDLFLAELAEQLDLEEGYCIQKSYCIIDSANPPEEESAF